MTFTDAAAEVLRLAGKPLHYKEITDIAIEKNLLSHVGKNPEVTMGTRLTAMLKKDTPENPLVRVKPGVFALREWDEKTIKSGLEKKDGKKSKAEAKGGGDEVEAEADDLDVALEEPEAAAEGDNEEPVARVAAPRHEEARGSAPARQPRPTYDEDLEPQAPDEAMRAEAVARAGELFDEEEDDDQPILGGDDRPPGPQAAGGEPGSDGRRRRRRRRRGRGGDGEREGGRPSGQGQGGGGGLPSYTASPVGFEARRDGAPEGRRDNGVEGSYRGPQVIDLAASDGPMLDDLAGRELADAVAVVLSTFDRNAGAVSLRQIAETAQRRGRLQGDAQLAQSQIAAAVRGDNHRRMASGMRPRFRFAGGRVALTDWLLGNDLTRLEQEALAAVERYREAARRSFAKKLGELPGHAFVEICVLALERVGVGQLRALRRAGAPGGETHFSGVVRAAGEGEVKTAIVIRRDGREIGRERVTELRGALHHYGPATCGWIFTAGQTLSGAREEASVPGTAPIALFDGLAVARLCEDNDVGVIRARLPISIPDVDLLEALRAS